MQEEVGDFPVIKSCCHCFCFSIDCHSSYLYLIVRGRWAKRMCKLNQVVFSCTESSSPQIFWNSMVSDSSENSGSVPSRSVTALYLSCGSSARFKNPLWPKEAFDWSEGSAGPANIYNASNTSLCRSVLLSNRLLLINKIYDHILVLGLEFRRMRKGLLVYFTLHMIIFDIDMWAF